MFPDLGKYVIPVLSAYGAMFALVGGLIFISIKEARKSKATLAKLEEKRKGNRS